MKKTQGKRTARFYGENEDGDDVFIERKLTEAEFHQISRWLMYEDKRCTVDRTEIVTAEMRRAEKNAKEKLVRALARAKKALKKGA